MNLSQQDLEICKYLAEGRKNTEIARKLFLSEHTIKARISKIMTCLGACNRTRVAYILGKENIINV